MLHINRSLRWVLGGTLFAVLWASASTSTKIGLTVVQPLVLAEVRFAVASFIMLFIVHIILGQRLPTKSEWKQLVVYGLLNISIYLGLYVVAMKDITAGIGALGVGTNPVFISFLGIFFLKKKLHYTIIFSLIVCTLGVVCASWPLLGNATVNIKGLIILLVSMLSYSIGALYFSSKQWNGLSLLTINGWQTIIGGLLLLPFTIFFYKSQANQFNTRFWLSVTWLAIPVSIVAVQLWLWLLQLNAIRAGLWLFLCPLFGFIIAAMILQDSINTYTIVGILLVIAGLLLSRVNMKKSEVLFD
jgi:drug/metabolite transporter (DMT)-like permease